jgi:hypothetical protein
MADYTPPKIHPSSIDLRREYCDQSESDDFTEKARKMIHEVGLDENIIVLNCIAFLYQRDGISELTEFMSYIKSSYDLIDNSKSQSKIYEFAKALPALSGGKIGYTFKKKKGGLFFFLTFD